MKRKTIFSLFIIFAWLNNGFATKIISAGDADWDHPITWNGNIVPSNPDTIIIRHYITFSHDLTINAPTVLIIEDGGTLCGDYLLDVTCGATVLNYGHLYLNTARIRNGSNYNEFYAKSQITLLGCTPATNGFSNVPPNGQMKVWPPVLCKTADTNWPKGTTNIPGNGTMEEFYLSVSPNPLNSGYLNISAKGDFEIKLYDTRGALLYEGSGNNQAAIDMHGYANGFYYVALTYKNKQVFRKVLVDQ